MEDHLMAVEDLIKLLQELPEQRMPVIVEDRGSNLQSSGHDCTVDSVHVRLRGNSKGVAAIIVYDRRV